MTSTSGGTVMFDFDGVFHSYESGWGDGSIYGTPIDGSPEGLQTVHARFACGIFTSRDAMAVAAWMAHHYHFGFVVEQPEPDMPGMVKRIGFGRDAAEETVIAVTLAEFQEPAKFWDDRDHILVTNRKLPALVYVDDRGLRFENWFQTMADLSRLLEQPKGVR